MKLFGNSKRPNNVRTSMRESEDTPQLPTEERSEEFDLSGKDFEDKLKMLLDGEALSSAEQLKAEPPKKMDEPVNTDYHVAYTPSRKAKVIVNEADEAEDEAPLQMAGWLKGTLLLLASLVIFVLVVFGVYVNLI